MKAVKSIDAERIEGARRELVEAWRFSESGAFMSDKGIIGRFDSLICSVPDLAAADTDHSETRRKGPNSTEE